MCSECLINAYTIKFNVRANSVKVYKSDPFLRKDILIVIADFGINVSTDSSTALIKWDEVYKVLENSNEFSIFTSINQSYILPKRHIGHSGLTEYMRNLFREKIPPKKLRLRN
jgi:hypothetical protein